MTVKTWGIPGACTIKPLDPHNKNQCRKIERFSLSVIYTRLGANEIAAKDTLAYYITIIPTAFSSFTAKNILTVILKVMVA